ncbi:flagellin C protein [Acetobacter nitrogenifigens DSM 23921 = NBRC 105050]|uniref:Flagellin n=1 Tax=Acetobacter nitrogenifigens DSM 23921 = NBRC 105050 TaxID=1120919 RepID=A0A511XA36_9PROT|nr:flagellin [Acetobacter nitrogenifigens]GBQ97737.1 flagellin C protein [Acetobacter nitrogenifigens DSM 23921 = NBRC 105050]GEN59814.1 flagellin [Acetobacter nitrogenifigens DSM 23921 = NBRC 105050]
MSLSINTNVGAMVALESLNATTDALNEAQNEVSTGLKVSTASDGPATYAISQQISGNISGLSAVNDGLSTAAQTVSTTSSATSQIISTLQLLQTAVTSLGSNQGDTTALAQTAQEINGYLDQINTLARNATVNGVNLLTSATDANTANQGAAATGAVTAGTLTYVTGLQGSTSTITNALTSTDISGTVVAVGTNFAKPADTNTLTDALGLSSGMAAGDASVTTAGQNVFVTTAGVLTEQSTDSAGTAYSANAISDMVSVVQNAITAMTNVASTLGTNTQTITGMTTYSSNLSDSLTSTVGALTDADMAAESAKLTSLQTKQELAISSLSLAKSSSQNILTLFR